MDRNFVLRLGSVPVTWSTCCVRPRCVPAHLPTCPRICVPANCQRWYQTLVHTYPSWHLHLDWCCLLVFEIACIKVTSCLGVAPVPSLRLPRVHRRPCTKTQSPGRPSFCSHPASWLILLPWLEASMALSSLRLAPRQEAHLRRPTRALLRALASLVGLALAPSTFDLSPGVSLLKVTRDSLR